MLPSPAYGAPSHPPDARCSRQNASAEATHLIPRLRCSLFGLPTSSSLALLGGPARVLPVSHWTAAKRLSQERSSNGRERSGKTGNWEPGPGLGLGLETGTGTATHPIDSALRTLIMSGASIADSTSQHIACTSLLQRMYINQSRLPISLSPCPLLFLFFPLPATVRTLASASHVSTSIPRTLVRVLRLVPRHRYFRPQSSPTLARTELELPRTPTVTGRKERPAETPKLKSCDNPASSISNFDRSTRRQESRRRKKKRNREKGKGIENNHPIVTQDGCLSLFDEHFPPPRSPAIDVANASASANATGLRTAPRKDVALLVSDMRR